MTKLKETCNRVLEAAEKATEVGKWKSWDNFIEIKTCGLQEINTGNPMVGDSSNDTHYIVTAANSAEKLARAVMVMGSAGFSHEIICLVCQTASRNKPKHEPTCWYGKALAEAEKIMGDL